MGTYPTSAGLEHAQGDNNHPAGRVQAGGLPGPAAGRASDKGYDN